MARPETEVQVKACLDPASLLAASWGYTGTPGDLKGLDLAPTSLVNQWSDPSHPCLALGLGASQSCEVRCFQACSTLSGSLESAVEIHRGKVTLQSASSSAPRAVTSLQVTTGGGAKGRISGLGQRNGGGRG